MAKKEINIGGLVTLEQVKFNWTRLVAPDEHGKYSVHCSEMDDAKAEELKAIGLDPKHGNDRVDADGKPKPTPEWQWYITPRTKYEFAVVDGTGKEIINEDKENFLKAIGDGSIANVEVKSGSFNVAGKKGVSCYLQAIQILELVRDGNNHGFGEVKGAYQHEETAVAADDVPFN